MSARRFGARGGLAAVVMTAALISAADEIETDRDAFTFAPTTVAVGRTLLETAYSFIDNRVGPEAHSVPELLARFGMGSGSSCGSAPTTSRGGRESCRARKLAARTSIRSRRAGCSTARRSRPPTSPGGFRNRRSSCRDSRPRRGHRPRRPSWWARRGAGHLPTAGHGTRRCATAPASPTHRPNSSRTSGSAGNCEFAADDRLTAPSDERPVGAAVSGRPPATSHAPTGSDRHSTRSSRIHTLRKRTGCPWFCRQTKPCRGLSLVASRVV